MFLYLHHSVLGVWERGARGAGAGGPLGARGAAGGRASGPPGGLVAGGPRGGRVGGRGHRRGEAALAGRRGSLQHGVRGDGGMVG